MIVLDASVLIAHLDPQDAHHAAADDFLRQNAAAPFGTGPVTMAEVLVGPVRAGRAERLTRDLRRLGVEVIDMVAESPRRLAELRVQTGLRMPDCCVLLAAEQLGAELATFDVRLADAARHRGIIVHGRP